MKVRSIASLLTAAVALGLLGTAAKADSIQVVGSPVLSANGSNTDFSYTVVLTEGNFVQTGDFFTLVDFNGFVGVVSKPAAWTTFSTAALANTPVGSATFFSAGVGGAPDNYAIPTTSLPVIAADSTTIPDLVFVYSGPNITAISGGGNVTLGTFTLTSTFNAIGTDSTIVGSDHQIGGLPGRNGDPYLVPGSAPLATPLPAAAWGGISLLGALGGIKALRRRRA